MDRHMHTNRTRKRRETKWKRDPKHQNSINPLRRSLKGFLKADAQRLSRSTLFVVAVLLKHSCFTPSPFHSATSHFFTSHMQSFPLSAWISLPNFFYFIFLAFLPASLCYFDTTFTLSWINPKGLLMNETSLQWHCIRLAISICFSVHKSQI